MRSFSAQHSCTDRDAAAVPDTIRVEVAFALPDEQQLVELEVSDGATVAEVIDASGIRDAFPQVDFDELKRGIWGRIVGDADRVRAGDRVEIYRPLVVEPREARRQRAAKDPS